jgi:uncharacterized membrane protein
MHPLAEPLMTRTIVSRFHLFLLLVMVAITATAFFKVPAGAQLALHWTLRGDADWALARDAGFFVLPVVALMLTGICALLSLRKSKAALDMVRHVAEPALIYALLLLDGFQFGLVLSALGSDIDLIRVLGFATAAGLAGAGIVLNEAERNAYGGLRLPWSIPSDMAFRPLHRLAAILLIVAGLGVAAVAWLTPFPGYVIAASLAALIVPLALAYLATLMFGRDRRHKPV